MSPQMFAIALAIGAALLAFWFQLRFSRLAPQSLGRGMLHLFAAMAATQLVKPAFAASESVPISTIVLVFGLALPVLVYAFVAGMWLVRLAQGAGGGGMTH